MVLGSSFSKAYPSPAKINIPMLTVIVSSRSSLFVKYQRSAKKICILQDSPNYSHLWLFCKVVPKVLRPVICLESLKILRILRMRKIWAALARWSREFPLRRLRIKEKKKGRIPRRSITFRKSKTKSHW